MRFSSAAFLALLISSSPCAAIDITAGSTVKVLTALPLRTEPPGGLFGFKGTRIGEVAANGIYKVLETKSITTVGGGEEWIKVQDPANQNKAGWIYYGQKNALTGNAVVIGR